MELNWQSKLVLLLVLPALATELVLKIHWWAVANAPVVVWTVGLSALLGLVTWKLRAATAHAAATGILITASLMFSTVGFPYEPWHTALLPVLAVALLAFAATQTGRGRKERLGIAEARTGRAAAQVAANLGMAALASTDFMRSLMGESRWFERSGHPPLLLFAVGLAALAEAAGDTVSSEMGQVLGGRPRMITTLRVTEAGRNGAVSLAGTLTGAAAAGLVAAAGTWALRGDRTLFAVSWVCGVLGFLADSLLGATLEDRGWLNNDAVNFLSTAAAAGFAAAALAVTR